MWIQAVRVECSPPSFLLCRLWQIPALSVLAKVDDCQDDSVEKSVDVLRMGLACSECLMSIKVIFLILLWKHNNAHKGLVLSTQKKYCSNDPVSFN